MKFVLLLRGINVGGKNKVVMAELKAQLSEAGFNNVSTYINSGNILFNSDYDLEKCQNLVHEMLAKHYDFNILFTLITAEAYRKESLTLPNWWSEPLARKDVLFYTDVCDKKAIVENLKTFPLHNEVIHFGQHAIFWGKYDETEYLKTAYHKHLIKQPYYKQITIRNGKTFEKLLELIEK